MFSIESSRSILRATNKQPVIDLIELWQSWSHKDALGYLSIAITLLAFVIYLRQTYFKQVLPHALTWFLFSATTGVAYCAQVLKGAGAGSWAMGLTAGMSFLLFAYSWYKGGRLSHSADDWIFFWGALVVMGCYVGTVYVYEMDPTVSAVVATLADLLAYAPTIRKGWLNPHSDSVTSYTLNSAKFIPALFAMESYSLATILLPGVLVITNAAVAAMLLWRRWRMTIKQQRTS